MRNLIALVALLMVTCWPFSGRARGRHRAQTVHRAPSRTLPLPRGVRVLPRLRLDVVAGRRRREERAGQNSAPFPPPVVERAEYFPPRDAAEAANFPGRLVPRWLDILAPDTPRPVRQVAEADPWT